ncbi:MAG: hypothetical protein WD766_12465 [Gemmatimonadota bacterium]
MRRTAIFACAIGLASLAAAGASAQEVADTAQAPQPFVAGGVYDKPYLTSLLGRTAIGGYAEAHSRWEQTDGIRDGLGFELRRWNIFTATQVNEIVRIGAELEFEELGEEVTLEFAAIDVAVHPSFTVRAGAILSPLGRFNLSHDSPRNEFTDRPLVSTQLIGTALTEPGIGALGLFTLGGAGRLTYEVYAVNGFHDGLINDSPDGTRIPVGKKNAEDNNGSPAAVGRIAWSPHVDYEVGISGHRGAYNTFLLDGEQVDDKHLLSIWAFDMEAMVGGVELSGEMAVAELGITPGLKGIYATSQRGIYVQAVREFGRGWVRTMPRSFFALAARYDGVDFDADLVGDSVQRITAGLNFRPSEDAVLKLDYYRGWTRDRFNNGGDEAGALFSIATYF